MTDTSHYETCRKTMKFLKHTAKWRFIITAFSIVINSLMYFIHMFTSAIGFDGRNTFLSFLFLLATLVVGSLILYLSASASAAPEKPKILLLLLGVLGAALLTKIVLNVFGFLLPLWASQFLEVKKAKWLIRQEGYPYFNERFEKQKVNNEYVPVYTTDGNFQGSNANITEPIPEDAAASVPVQMPEIPEMPGIPEIPELPE